MKQLFLILTSILMLALNVRAESARNYQVQIESLLKQSKTDNLENKKKRILEIYKIIKKDFADSAYPENIEENYEMSWKAEMTIGIEILQLKQLDSKKCESIRTHLIVQLNSPSVENKEEQKNVTNLIERKLPKDLVREILEYLCYE